MRRAAAGFSRSRFRPLQRSFQFTVWPSLRTASGSPGAGTKKQPRCGTRSAAKNCSPSKGTLIPFRPSPFLRTASGLPPQVTTEQPRRGMRPAAGIYSHSMRAPPRSLRWENLPTFKTPFRVLPWPSLRMASDRERLVLTGRGGVIVSVAFSPDGKRIVTGGSYKTATVWEAASGKELLTLKGHSAEVVSVAFSPDGNQIATASEDATVRLWDAVNGQELRTIKGHNRGVSS